MKHNKNLKFIGLFYIWILCFLMFFCIISFGIGIFLDTLLSEQNQSFIFGTPMSINRFLFAFLILAITSILVLPLWILSGNKIFPNLKFNERFRQFWLILNERKKFKDTENGSCRKGSR